MQKDNVLSVEDLSVTIKGDKRSVVPVQGVSFTIPKGKVVGMVGESGCGKSMTARSIMGLLPKGGFISSGRILFGGEEISSYTEKQMLAINGKRISMIFQEPMSSLNPVMKVGKQVEEVLRLHTDMNRAAAKKAVVDIFAQVGIPEPEQRYNAYPFQLSGGLRQRVMIAMAMVCNPELLIADEPTTALDVTIEAQILRLMRNLQREYGTSILMITHNLGVVAKICDQVNVMYLGQIVESCDTAALFAHPMHPYTKGLIASVPRIGQEEQRLSGIRGTVPPLNDLPTGCRFSTRCPYATDRCRQEAPPLTELEAGHSVRCFFPREEGQV
ncbi:MAG: ABC transporter ATP-binding protein [Oscillospiraceae bacterium]|nr:ABC transporter ATP-binding protein [Oscillospiraceae bacterium]